MGGDLGEGLSQVRFGIHLADDMKRLESLSP